MNAVEWDRKTETKHDRNKSQSKALKQEQNGRETIGNIAEKQTILIKSQIQQNRSEKQAKCQKKQEENKTW